MFKKITFVLLILLACLICYPVLFLLTGSLMGSGEIQEYLQPVFSEEYGGFAVWRLLPALPTLKHYVYLLLDSPDFFVMFWNSFKYTFSILGVQMAAGVPAAWAFARYSFPFKRILFYLYIVLMMMPFQVTMLSSYLILDTFHLIDNPLSVILPAGFSTFPVFIMHRFFHQIPESLMESAKIDGAGMLQVFYNIGIPLGSPGIISSLVLGFLEYWNLIEQPMTFLSTRSLWPLSLYLPEISTANAGSAFAASLLTLAPSIFLFFAGQDFLEQGIMATAIKE